MCKNTEIQQIERFQSSLNCKSMVQLILTSLILATLTNIF